MKKFSALGMLSGILIAATPAGAALEISDQPTESVVCSDGTCSATAKNAVLNVTELAGKLADGDVVVASGSLAKNIALDAALSWTSVHRLTLDSYLSIAFNAPVVVAGTGALTITTNDGGNGGDFRFFKKGHVEFWDLTSSLIINGESYRLQDKLKHLARAIRGNGSANYALSRSSSEKNHIYDSSPIPSLSGKFEGLGNTISDLNIDSSSHDPQLGLFAQLATAFSAIRDIGLKSVNIQSAASITGALVGSNFGGTITNSYATGQISTTGNGMAGGLVGYNATSPIRRSFANVTVTGNGASTLGGLIGENENGCRRCSGVIEKSFALGAVSGGDGATVGGLVGLNHAGVISKSYAMGAVSGGDDAFVGGLVGNNSNYLQQQTIARIANSYSTGSVSGGSDAIAGGLIGQDTANSRIANTYWDLDTSGIGDPQRGAGNVTDDPGITGLTTEQFKSGLPAGFDPGDWKEKTRLNSGYPYLTDNPPPK